MKRQVYDVEGCQLRVLVEDDGSWWVVARDLMVALGYNPKTFRQRLRQVGLGPALMFERGGKTGQWLRALGEAEVRQVLERTQRRGETKLVAAWLGRMASRSALVSRGGQDWAGAAEPSAEADPPPQPAAKAPAGLVAMQFEGLAVRVIPDEHGEPWFVANEVCQALGYSNIKDALRRHCVGGSRNTTPLQTPGGVQQARVLSEADVMRLIVHSKLPVAQRFERWVFEEVLPTIRKTGRYEMPGAVPAPGPAEMPPPEQLRREILEMVKEVVREVVGALVARPSPALSLPSARGTTTLPPGGLLTLEDLGWRWRSDSSEPLDRRTVTRIVARLGLRAIRLGHRTVRYRAEDVDDAERACQWKGAKGPPRR